MIDWLTTGIGWNGFLSVLNSAGELEGDRVGA